MQYSGQSLYLRNGSQLQRAHRGASLQSGDPIWRRTERDQAQFLLLLDC